MCAAMGREYNGDYIMNCVCRYSLRDVLAGIQGGVCGQVYRECVDRYTRSVRTGIQGGLCGQVFREGCGPVCRGSVDVCLECDGWYNMHYMDRYISNV